MVAKAGKCTNAVGKVPRVNNLLYEKASKDHKQADTDLQKVQGYIVAAMSAVASQAESTYQQKQWAKSVNDPAVNLRPNANS